MLLDPLQSRELFSDALRHKYAVLAVNADSPAAINGVKSRRGVRECAGSQWRSTPSGKHQAEAQEMVHANTPSQPRGPPSATALGPYIRRNPEKISAKTFPLPSMDHDGSKVAAMFPSR